MDLSRIYEARPFKTRNADEFDLKDISDLFVDPTDGVIRPFDYENVIVKGKMGSGKTMYLRANQAYYLYTLVSDLLNGDEIILPIYINLSELQSLNNCDKIYSEILVKIIMEMANVCEFLSSSTKMAEIHMGFQSLGISIPSKHGIKEIYHEIDKMTANEYIEIVSKELETTGSLACKFINLCRAISGKYQIELKKTRIPKFEDIKETYEKIIKQFSGKIIILIDEVSSLHKSFFKENMDEHSGFEILMNQLRTLTFVRTKIAIYPHSYSDILTETRYGDSVELEADVKELGYESYKNRVITLIERYIEKAIGKKINIENVFELDENMSLIEQLIYASSGNMRRLVHLLDLTMDIGYKTDNGKYKISLDNVKNALFRQARESEKHFTESEKEWVSNIAKVCKNRNAYKFSFPNNTLSLDKYTNKSSEFNIINKIENGQGRKSSTYEFDYAYCIYKEIPTHYIKNTERLDKARSRYTGDFIKKVTKITDNLIEQANLDDKVEGEIRYVNDKNEGGFVRTANGEEYFFHRGYVITDDKDKKFIVGHRLRFVPMDIAEQKHAAEIEII